MTVYMQCSSASKIRVHEIRMHEINKHEIRMYQNALHPNSFRQKAISEYIAGRAHMGRSMNSTIYTKDTINPYYPYI